MQQVAVVFVVETLTKVVVEAQMKRNIMDNNTKQYSSCIKHDPADEPALLGTSLCC
jgi:hypothetical protein